MTKIALTKKEVALKNPFCKNDIFLKFMIRASAFFKNDFCCKWPSFPPPTFFAVEKKYLKYNFVTVM